MSAVAADAAAPSFSPRTVPVAGTAAAATAIPVVASAAESAGRSLGDLPAGAAAVSKGTGAVGKAVASALAQGARALAGAPRRKAPLAVFLEPRQAAPPAGASGGRRLASDAPGPTPPALQAADAAAAEGGADAATDDVPGGSNSDGAQGGAPAMPESAAAAELPGTAAEAAGVEAAAGAGAAAAAGSEALRREVETQLATGALRSEAVLQPGGLLAWVGAIS
jgi:hypothetical protein